MEQPNALEKARELIDEEKPKEALRLLKPLYDADRKNAEVLLEIVTAMEMLGQWEKVREALNVMLKREPGNVEYWLRLTYAYSGAEQLPAALKVIDAALKNVPGDPDLISRKAGLLDDAGQQDDMIAFTDAMIAAFPEHKSAILSARAGLFESAAMNPAEDEAVIKDFMGMTYGVRGLERAVEDLSEIVDAEPEAWRVFVRRAHVRKKLQRFDDAVADYDAALERMDAEGEPFRAFIEQEREGCLNGGQNERSHYAGMIKEGIVDVGDKGEITQEEHMANAVAEALADQFEHGDPLGLLEGMGDDPDEMTAMTLAQTIIKNARAPFADFQETYAGEYEKAAQRFCDKAEGLFKQQGYSVLGDFEPKGLAQQMGKRLFFRLFLSQDRTTNGSAYYIKPLWPGLLSWILLRLSGQWKVVRIVELESETADGRFILTNNTGDINAFAPAENVETVNLPLNTSPEEVFSRHHVRLEALMSEGVELETFDSVEAIFAMQERLRRANNAHRERIGFVTDDELQKLLGKNYDRFAEKIKKYLVKLA